MLPNIHRSILSKATLLFSLSQPKLQNWKAHFVFLCDMQNNQWKTLWLSECNNKWWSFPIHFWVNIAKLNITDSNVTLCRFPSPFICLYLCALNVYWFRFSVKLLLKCVIFVYFLSLQEEFVRLSLSATIFSHIKKLSSQSDTLHSSQTYGWW